MIFFCFLTLDELATRKYIRKLSVPILSDYLSINSVTTSQLESLLLWFCSPQNRHLFSNNEQKIRFLKSITWKVEEKDTKFLNSFSDFKFYDLTFPICLPSNTCRSLIPPFICRQL